MSGRQLVPRDSAELVNALAAPTGDPLWMLSQQFALGELTLENVGSPVRVRVELETIPVGEDTEAQVEATPLTGMPRLRLAVEISRAVRAAVPEAMWTRLTRRFPVEVPSDLTGTDHARATLWCEGQIDGWKILEGGPPQAQKAAQRWMKEHYAHRPGLWQTEKFQFHGHQGAISVVEHDGGALRWTHVRRRGGRAAAAEPQTVIPAPLAYRGMPARRWWSREDYRVDFAALASGDVDDLSAIVAEFAVQASDDWFLVPVDLAVGALWRIKSLTVVDSFGEETQSTDLNDEIQSLWQLEGDHDGWRFVPGPTASIGPAEAAAVLHRDERTNSGWVHVERFDTVFGSRGAPPPPAPAPVHEPTWRLEPGPDPSLFAWVPRHDQDTNRFVFQRTFTDQPVAGDLLGELSNTPVPEEAVRQAATRLELRWQRMVLSNGQDIAWRTWRTAPSSASSPGLLYDHVVE